MIALLTVSAGCSTSVAGIDPPSASTTPKPSPKRVADSSESRKLGSGTVKGAIQEDGLTATVEYTPSVAVAEWTASGPKSVRLVLSSFNKNYPGQEIYLAKVTATFYVDNGIFETTASNPIVDEAAVVPGYLISFPSTYAQSVDVPILEGNAQSLTITFKYEVLSRTANSKGDFTKQVLQDTVVAQLSF